MQKQWILFPTVWVFLLLGHLERGWAKQADSALEVDLQTAVVRALQENRDIQAKRHTLGLATGRVQESRLRFQKNPRVRIEADYRHRRHRAPTGRSTSDASVSLLQEVEIAGQSEHRQQAASTHLAYTEQVIADAERLLQLSVTHAFYELLLAQERIKAQQPMVLTREALLRAGRERFEREDISVLELDTLQLDADQARTRLLTQKQAHLLAEKQLLLLLGTDVTKPLVAVGNLLRTSAQSTPLESLPSQEELIACALEYRPDYHAARLKVLTHEAELRLARSNRIPNISLGPMYRLDDEDQIVGGALNIPLPLFSRNAHEITAAMAKVEIARRELQAQALAVHHGVSATYLRLQLAQQYCAVYGENTLDTLTQRSDFARQAYVAGEMSIFEFSVTLERLTQVRTRILDAVLSVYQARADFTAQLAFQCLDTD